MDLKQIKEKLLMANAFSRESRIILIVILVVVAVFTWMEMRDINHDQCAIELLDKNVHMDDARLDNLEARVKALEAASKAAAPVAQ
jgi:hypothetical protein